MSFRNFAKQCIMRFFIITTVTAAIGLLGNFFTPGKTIGFGAFYSPLLAGLFGKR